MRADPTPHGADPAPLRRPAEGDGGWIGTRELPGYRAGRVVAKLAELTVADARRLYLDLLWLDAAGRTEDTLSGPCRVMTRDTPLDERSRYVRVVAELLRHVPDPALGLAGLEPVLDLLREQGVAGVALALAAQRLDAVSSESALVAGLSQMLRLSLGEDEARDTLRRLLARLDRERAPAGFDPARCDIGLDELVGALVRLVGQARARRVLREATDFELLPTPALLGL